MKWVFAFFLMLFVGIFLSFLKPHTAVRFPGAWMFLYSCYCRLTTSQWLSLLTGSCCSVTFLVSQGAQVDKKGRLRGHHVQPGEMAWLILHGDVGRKTLDAMEKAGASGTLQCSPWGFSDTNRGCNGFLYLCQDLQGNVAFVEPFPPAVPPKDKIKAPSHTLWVSPVLAFISDDSVTHSAVSGIQAHFLLCTSEMSS